MTDNTKTLAVMEPRSKPDLDLMIRELRDAINAANALGVFEKLETCHMTKRCLWANQRADGRYGAPAKDTKNLYWWQGAPETRRHKADEIVLERAGIRALVLHRGQVSVTPSLRSRSVGEMGLPDEANVDAWQIVLDYYRKLTQRKTTYAWRLHSTTVEEFGYSIMHTAWVNRWRDAKRTLSLEQLLELIAGRERDGLLQEFAAGGVVLPDSGQLAPEIVMQIQERAQMTVDLLLAAAGSADAVQYLIETVDPDMNPAEARIVLRELAAGKAATYYAPEDAGGIPVPMALVPWVNVIHPASLTGDGDAAWFAIPEWMDRAELENRAAAEGWDEAFVKKVLEHPNKMMPELLSISLANAHSWVLCGAGIGLQIDQNNANDQSPLYNVTHVWREAVSAAGRKMIYRTVMNPLVTDVCGLHECTKLKALPFNVDTSEPVNNAMLARGVGEVVVAPQNHIMDLMDGEGARAQLGSNPPLQRGADQHVPVRPGMQIHTRTVGTRGVNEFLQTPRVDEGALKLIEIHERNVDLRYFRGEFSDPDTKAQQKELLAYEAMDSLAAFWRLTWAVIQANLDELRLERIAGRDVHVSITGEELQGESEIDVGFNVSGLNGDSSDKWMTVLEKLLAFDNGELDRGAILMDLAMMMNPAMAKRLIIPGDVAAGKVADDQETRIAKIMAGVPVRYPQRQTNPQLRGKIQQNWEQTPGNIPRALQDETVATMMQKEKEYLKDQEVQYQDNPIVGRTLAKPNV